MIDIVLISILLICVITDIRSRKIYNKVTYPALLFALIYHTAIGGWEGLSHSLVGLLVGGGLLLIPYFLGGMGAGDVKLLALIGAMKGGLFIFQAFLYIAIVGGLIALGVMFYKKLKHTSFKSIGYFLFNLRNGPKTGGTTIPYGVPIAIGSVACLVMQGWVM